VLPERDGPGVAWLAAAQYLQTCPGRHAYNLIYAISRPGELSNADRQIIKNYDAFAVKHGLGTATTVANTIFPLDSYRSGGTDGLFNAYHQEVYSRVKKGWGNYFDRMTRRRHSNGQFILDQDGAPLNPLKSLVQKLRRRVETGRGPKGHYELSVADEGYELATYLPERDKLMPRGGPCLSHVSFKLDDSNAIRLTAFYRSHYYVERALGNLIGLARLQTFVAAEAGCHIGSLTCIAASAYLEATSGSAHKAEIDGCLLS